MAENFNKLISNLSVEERHGLLERLKSQSSLSAEPLYNEESTAVPSGDFETGYSKLPWFYRLWYYIVSLFKSKSPAKIFEDSRVSLLGSKIEEKTPGLYDYQNGMLLPLFYRQMEKLKEASHFFYSALDASVNRDRGAFFSFLSSLEMPNVHKALQRETDLEFIAEKHKDLQEQELRQMALKAMDEALNLVTDENRNTMYFNARSLNCLKALSSFLFDRVLMAFSFSKTENGETCSAGVVRELLLTLNNILLSLKVVPPMTLLESLFVFILHEKAGEQNFDITREIHILLAKAENSLAIIREFNRHVPLTWILRCSTRDMSLSAREISGGEDWFVVYRDYWKKRIESMFSNYSKEHRQKELMEILRYFLKGKELQTLDNIKTDLNPDGMPIKGAFALSFLYTFYSAVFMPDINWVLRPILIDGDFQNKEGRIEFTESYNNLIKLEDEIKKLDSKMSPSGDYGERYKQVRQEMTSLPVKRRKIQIVLEDAEEDAGRILEQAGDAFHVIVKVLNGILGRDINSKSYALNNLAKISEKESGFVTGMGEVVLQFQRVVKLLEDMEAIENS
jgi:hypothetical protein